MEKTVIINEALSPNGQRVWKGCKGQKRILPYVLIGGKYSTVRATYWASYSRTMCQHPDISTDDAGNGNA